MGEAWKGAEERRNMGYVHTHEREGQTGVVNWNVHFNCFCAVLARHSSHKPILSGQCTLAAVHSIKQLECTSESGPKS